jgi:hypothetical protein
MKKILLAASAAIAALSVAPAANASVAIVCPGFSLLGYCTFDEPNQTGNFGNSFASSQGFADSFKLTLTDLYELSITATNTAVTGGPISFTTAALLDSSLASLGPIAFGAVPTTFHLAPGTYYLSFVGNASASASYGGTIDIAAIPEPAAWGMMIAGLAAVGVCMRRRAQTARVAFS